LAGFLESSIARLAGTLAGTALLAMAPAAAAPGEGSTRLAAPAYPRTRATALVETRFGERVADPYRWLENDVRKDSEVADWVARQEAVTRAYLDRLPGRDVLAGRIRALLAFERFGIPKKAGGRYFYTRSAGPQNQPVLYVRDGFKGEGRALIDPNGWSRDGSPALDAWQPSHSGKRLAFTVEDGGSDWRTIRFLDVRTGRPFADRLAWVKY
jgi:prolyl oligopeptidase